MWLERAQALLQQLINRGYAGGTLEAEQLVAEQLHRAYQQGMLAASKQPGVGLKAT